MNAEFGLDDDDWMLALATLILWRRIFMLLCWGNLFDMRSEYLYDAYSERDHIPLAK